jgi:hypothetical protein
MDKKKLWITVGGATLALCLTATCLVGIGGYVYWDRVAAMLGLAQPQKTAHMLPATTQFYASFTPNLQNVSGYQNLKTHYLDNPEVKAALDEFLSELEAETGLSFETDIQPWLGTEVVMAAPNFNETIEDSSGNTIPSFVLAAETTNLEASNQFIDKVLAQAAEEGRPFSNQTYQEVTLHVQDSSGNEDVYLATFNNFVTAANDEALIKSMIDQVQGRAETPALAESTRYQKVMQQLPANAILTGYFDFGGLMESVMQQAQVDLPAEQRQDFEAFEAVGLAGTLQADGVQLDSVISYDAAKMSETMKASLQQPASPNTIHQLIPAKALLVYNINNLNNVWQQTKRSLESTPDFAETLQDFETEMGLSIDDDVFGWMTGEFAIVMIETTPVDEFDVPFGGYVLIGTDDVEQAQSKVSKVMGVLEAQGGLPPLETMSVNGIDVQATTNFTSGEFEAGYGFHENYFFAAYKEDSVTALTSAGSNPLVSSDNFMAVRERLPSPNYGYFYVDMDRFQTLIESQLSEFDREEYNQKVRPFLEPMRALGASAEPVVADAGLTKGRFFFLIKE